MTERTCTCSNCTRPPRPAVLRDCVHCGQTFESRRGRTRCSAECRAARDRASLGASGKRRGTGHISRAKFYGVAFETFDRADIFDRDRWRCGICNATVDRSLTYPHPLSASLDHIVPMSRGGAHTPDNTQCSHLICNVEKGARISSMR